MQGMPGSRENALYAETIWETKVMTVTTFIFSWFCFYAQVFLSSCLRHGFQRVHACVRVRVAKALQ